MKPRCIDAVERAAGRQLNQTEIRGIEQRILKNQKYLASQDPDAWAKLSVGEQLDKAAEASIKELVKEAEQQKLRLQLTLLAKEKVVRETGGWSRGRMDALHRKIESITDGKGNFTSVETVGKSIATDAMRKLTDVFEALDPRILGLFENQEGRVAFVKAMFGETEGIDPKIIKAAEAWRETAEDMRTQFNDQGGKIGKLENWVAPTKHSQLRVAKAGVDVWVKDTLPLLDRRKYINDDGSRMNEEQLTNFLREAWDTISSNGWNAIKEAERQGKSMLANRRAQHREIHFKDADSYMKYSDIYTDQPLLKTIVDHVHGLGRDIALLREFGPNPDALFAYLRDLGLSESVMSDRTRAGKYEAQAEKLNNIWRFTTGQEPVVANQRLANFGDGLRNWLVHTRLGGAVISSIADEGTMLMVAHQNNMSYMKVFGNELKAMNLANSEELRQARRTGLALDTMLGDMNRWGQDNLSSGVTSKLAHATLKVSGLQAMTAVRQRAFGVTMMDSLGHLTRGAETLKSLDKDDHRILLSKGVTEQDWTIWRMAEPENWKGNNSVLTPDSIYNIANDKLRHLLPDLATMGESGADFEKAAYELKRSAAIRLIGTVAEEVDMAVITPKNMERRILGGGNQRGTWKGELVRSIVLFKSTPVAAMLRHFARAMANDTSMGKALAVAKYVAVTTLLGAVTLEVKQLIKGDDPLNLLSTEGDNSDHLGRNWVQAFLQGGSFGIYGDFLFSNVTRHDTSPTAALLGPVVSMIEQTFNLTQGSLVAMAQDKETKAGAKAFNMAKQNIPFASVWYTKAALDHLIFNEMQESISPGYLATTKARNQSQFGAKQYWDTTTNEMRAPNLGRIAGQY